ncbi:acetyl-CoA carboxylase (plasmid) [Nicoliella spurrieriana]|uniref:Acetyl-CoA carboxylase n=1 Tax=Nicoliella spurrieriana TaxID=2925830 RepID=A0A976X4U1_9LACO|nr:acetyl-CoA carboxylase [Nicoliella spurrieriana]UQS86084.1 acetyl-CoA carboxylase [Nicoliella spurrieriana]
MDAQEVTQHANLIFKRLTPWFKRIPNTRYRLIVVNDVYDHCYNFYIEISRKLTLTRLVPLHEIDDYDLMNLGLILKALNHNCQLPIDFRQFSDNDKRFLNGSFH